MKHKIIIGTLLLTFIAVAFSAIPSSENNGKQIIQTAIDDHTLRMRQIDAEVARQVAQAEQQYRTADPLQGDAEAY